VLTLRHDVLTLRHDYTNISPYAALDVEMLDTEHIISHIHVLMWQRNDDDYQALALWRLRLMSSDFVVYVEVVHCVKQEALCGSSVRHCGLRKYGIIER